MYIRENQPLNWNLEYNPKIMYNVLFDFTHISQLFN